MKVVEFRQVQRATLVGFATVELDSGLRLRDVALHKKADGRWAGLPSKPMIDRDGQVMRDENGKPRYQPVVEIPDRGRRDRFNKQVWDAFESYQGGAING